MLIKILDEGNYIKVQYTTTTKYIQKSIIKNIFYNENKNDVTIIEHNNNTLVFNYKEVEDPENLTNSFSSIYLFWVYLLNMMRASIVIPTPPVITPNIKYGYLYNWYAVSNPLFAPVGWHVPTQAEFVTLISSTVDNLSIRLKEVGTTYWDSPNTGATNEFNFNARGSGFRYGNNGLFFNGPEYESRDANYSSITPYYYGEQESAINFVISNVYIQTSYRPNIDGSSVRFIKDDSTLIPSVTDIDGNTYRTTKIGDQVWLADNWACTKLNDGTPLTNVTDDTEWSVLITEGYCAYDNDENNVFL